MMKIQSRNGSWRPSQILSHDEVEKEDDKGRCTSCIGLILNLFIRDPPNMFYHREKSRGRLEFIRILNLLAIFHADTSLILVFISIVEH